MQSTRNTKKKENTVLRIKLLIVLLYLLSSMFFVSLSSCKDTDDTLGNTAPKEEKGLPLLTICTPNAVPIVSKDNYIEGATFSLKNTDSALDFDGEMKIKGRGNSTWDAPKKPYKIKFDTKVSFFGEPKDKEWILLANYYDKSMLRTDLSYWMASNYGKFDYVPRFHFVELTLNGLYNGVYQLGDQLKISKDRVNVGDEGFLLEIDSKAAQTDITFKIRNIPYPINIKEPDVVIGDDNYNYVVEYLTRANAALFAENWLDEDEGYKSMIDIQSFVEWYLMMEITKNKDANFYTSCYMNLSRTGKLKMGPLWDFDISLGGYPWGKELNCEFVNDPEGFYIKTHSGLWIERLFKDPSFVALVKERFNSYYKNKQHIIEHIDSVAVENKKSVLTDNRRWGVLCDGALQNEIAEATYLLHVETLKDWISKRLEWLKNAFDAL